MADSLLDEVLKNGVPPQGPIQVYALSIWKCVSRPYLARSFDYESRIKSFLHNYTTLLALCRPSGFKSLYSNDVYLWRDGEYLISAKAEHVITSEGEITLHFRRDHEPLYGCSFSLVPGHLVGVDDATVVLVSRMQGVAGKSEAIRQATRSCGNINPQAILYTALLGIAEASHVSHMVGVAAQNHVSFTQDRVSSFEKSYDEFYRTVGGRASSDAFFHLPVRFERRPLSDMSPPHRRRTRAKREFKDRLKDMVEFAWRDFMTGPAQASLR